MSTPPPGRTPAQRDPLKLLSAILTGLVLGFFAVLFAQRMLPWHEQDRTPAYTDSASRQSMDKPRAAAVPAAKPAAPVRHAEMVPPPASKPAPGEGKIPGKDDSLAPAAPIPASGKPETVSEAPKPAAAGPDQRSKAGSEPAKPSAAEAPPPAKAETAAVPVLVPASSAKPAKSLSAEEMTAALQPLLSYKISGEDAKAVKEAFEAAGREDSDDARAAIKKIADPSAKNFANWRRLRQLQTDVQEGIAFRLAHPLFPDLPQDGANEKALFLSNAPAAAVLKFYVNRQPLTGAGHASLGGALLETGERERGLAMIKFAWGRYVLDPAVEEKFRARFGAILNENDRRRHEQLLKVHAALKDDPGKDSEVRGRVRGLRAALKARAKTKARRGRPVPQKARHGNRRRRSDAGDGSPMLREAAVAGKARAFRVASLVEPVRYRYRRPAAASEDKDGKKAPDKDAGTLQSKAAANAFKLAKEVVGGPGTLLARLKALRRENADDDLWSLLRSIDPDSADLAAPDVWWEFRRSEVRRALLQDHPRTAYAIAKMHGPLNGENLSEAEFMAGWIALRFVHDPLLAVHHFEASRVAGFSRTEARAAYWLGRAKLEVGASKAAQRYFAEAASRFYTYYGGLARQAVQRANVCEFRAPAAPSPREIEAFVNEDAFRGVMIAKQLDMEPALNAYILDLARQLRDPVQMTLVLELAQRVTGPHVAVRAAKIALLRGFPVEAYAFPALLPKYSEAGDNAKLEAALLNALTRQESEFYTGTISPVGARGLMQLMPQTARQVAASAKMKYELARLVSDPSYNVTLGSVFLAQLVSAYGGSYVLSLAAYNAGPGRVAEWIKEFGDPRDKNVDPVDWVERIPFTETRQYVQKILESVQLYRCGFESSKPGFQLMEDLHRGRPGKIPDLEDIAGSGSDEAP
jgi:soluble lytic murein transglycosylase